MDRKVKAGIEASYLTMKVRDAIEIGDEDLPCTAEDVAD